MRSEKSTQKNGPRISVSLSSLTAFSKELNFSMVPWSNTALEHGRAYGIARFYEFVPRESVRFAGVF